MQLQRANDEYRRLIASASTLIGVAHDEFDPSVMRSRSRSPNTHNVILLRSADVVPSPGSNQSDHSHADSDSEEQLPAIEDAYDDSLHSRHASPMAAVHSVQQWGLAISSQLQAAISDTSPDDANPSSSMRMGTHDKQQPPPFNSSMVLVANIEAAARQQQQLFQQQREHWGPMHATNVCIRK